MRIAPTLRFALTGQPRSIEVSARDAAAGEVVVSGASLELVSNERRGVLVRAAVAPPFVGATIEGLGAPLYVTELGVRMAVMTQRDGTGEFRLRYRLRLGAGSSPGSYPWPVALSLEVP